MKLFLILVAVLAWATPAEALMRQVPMHEAVANSADIVAARVIQRVSHYGEDGRTIVTDVELEVASALKGSLRAGQRITLRTQGGEVGELGMWVEHQPTFTPGNETVVFLRPKTGAIREVQHLEQGKFTVVSGQVVDFRGRAQPLTSFQSEIRSLAGSIDE